MMKQLGLWVLAIGIILSGCNQNKQSVTNTGSIARTSLAIKKPSDNEIQNLIRQVLSWADSEDGIDLIPSIAENNDSIYIGMDIEKLRQNLIKLKETNLFSREFIENYNQIILTLDRKLKAEEFEYGPWFVGDMPPFNFASDVNPWCLCQDVPYDKPIPWGIVIVEHLEGHGYRWKWGEISGESQLSWKDFSYNFEVTKENSKWKVSYLQGFEISILK